MKGVGTGADPLGDVVAAKTEPHLLYAAVAAGHWRIAVVLRERTRVNQRIEKKHRRNPGDAAAAACYYYYYYYYNRRKISLFG